MPSSVVDARTFFTELYKGVGAGHIELRPPLDAGDARRGTEEGARLEATKRRWFAWPKAIGECASYCSSLSGGEFHVYFGVALRKMPGGGAKADVGCLTALFADVDFKHVPKEAAHAVIKSFPFEPSACVLSGNGVHVYWFLREPVFASGFADAERVNRAILVRIGAQVGPQNVDRILRVPGTANIKRAYPSPKPVASVSWWRPELRHDSSEFAAAFPAPPESPKEAFVQPELRLLVGGTELADRALEGIAKMMAETWIVGWRHYLSLYLGGMCAHAGLGEDSALRLVDRICALAADEEPADRAGAVRSSYAKRAAGEKVAGFTTLFASVKDFFPPHLLARAAAVNELLRAGVAPPETNRKGTAV